MAKVKAPKWRKWFRSTFQFKPCKYERERFLGYCRIKGDCWLWEGPSKYFIDGKGYPPRRMAYAMLRGPVEQDKRVGSTCRTRLHTCVMPLHMAVFTETDQQPRKKTRKISEARTV